MITRRVLRVKKVDSVRDERHRNIIETMGAIIEYKDYKWFVELDIENDEEIFEKFVSENNMESEYVMETKLHREFCVTDFDEDEYNYFINEED